ncbi:adenosylcobinamide-phosphate synthase CbiB [Actibacterium sp. 188UL27-1]|uniref:adenosylcobinamide-phosphate synthase CbiB n=1 Tax=Actibacterium sp. 188UL27-1 TaxID=2786961 RepID=UPI00195A4EC5|nr:adenosylcobinamide-phosphate synthase CbiB [Actibacterium sp. 188UL27-1]MBM7068631.1 cobalamin biosynthesis protein [Actibacterium sp. 188UL27-1]
MGAPWLLCVALVLDAALGEPRWLWSRAPHPAVLMGQAVDWVDQTLNHGVARRLKGAVATGGLAVIAVALGLAFSVHWLPEVIIVAILLAQRSLVDHVRAVAKALRFGVAPGRRAVAMIVGRDTGGMDKQAIARAAIESAAENLSDGVVAPVFWYLVGGLPGLILYKMTNTADSMIGYRTPRHGAFGWAAARLDDVLNWIPGRMTAALIALTHGGLGKWDEIGLDARLHRSPNAGWPEAAMARALDIALAGPRSYEGEMRTFPFVHASGHREIGPVQIDNAVRALWRSWAAMLAGVAILALVIG